LSTFKKGQKMTKWPNHFISGKQFQKRPNGNPDEWLCSLIPEKNGCVGKNIITAKVFSVK